MLQRQVHACHKSPHAVPLLCCSNLLPGPATKSETARGGTQELLNVQEGFTSPTASGFNLPAALYLALRTNFPLFRCVMAVYSLLTFYEVTPCLQAAGFCRGGVLRGLLGWRSHNSVPLTSLSHLWMET